jgi:hypothetical protein
MYVVAAFAEVIPLKEKVVADGEAIVTAAVPGKVRIIVPPAGIWLVVLNEILCMAVIGTIRASPTWCLLAKALEK